MIYQSFIIPVIIAVVALIVLISWLSGRARQKKLMELAKRNNLLFFAYDTDEKNSGQFNYLSGFSLADSNQSSGLRQFNLLTKGSLKFLVDRNIHVTNIFVKQDSEQKIRLFEYIKARGYGKNRHSTRYTCVRATLKKDIPDFVLRNENIFDKAGALFGYDDIDFERNEEFSKKYFLKSNSPNIKMFFSNDLLNFFVREKTDLGVETKGREILLYTEHRPAKVDDYMVMIKDAEKIISRLVDASGN